MQKKGGRKKSIVQKVGGGARVILDVGTRKEEVMRLTIKEEKKSNGRHKEELQYQVDGCRKRKEDTGAVGKERRISEQEEDRGGYRSKRRR